MYFRQLFDPETSTYSYLLADEVSRDAVLIDPVREQADRDLQLISEFELVLRYALETHVHADHVTGGGLLRERLGCKLALSERGGVLTADVRLRDGDRVTFGKHALEVRETPGHTDGCMTFVCHEEGMAFTGDALLIRGCGRTDFQQGDARTLFHSVRERILSLPPETRLYPAHDYKGRMVTTVAEELRFNPRLGNAKSEDEFVSIMSALDLAYPKRLDEAVPANMASGVTKPEALTASQDPADDWAPIEHTVSGVPVLAASWLNDHRGDVRIVDVREHLEFCGQLGHIEDAQIVPLAGLDERSRDWDRDAPLVLVCAWGTRSGKAAQMLKSAGFRKVASLHGGMVRWREQGHRVVEVLGDRGRQDAAAVFQGAWI